jgi:hypothetical protein
VDQLGPNAGKDVAQMDAAHKKGVVINNYDNISADLIVVGDPTFCPPFMAIHVRVISIVLINPYYISPDGGNMCGDWLAKPVCNPVFSNKAWRITGVGHTIEAGKYSTRISVDISTPGTDHKTPKDGGKFGAWNGGWKPVPC